MFQMTVTSLLNLAASQLNSLKEEKDHLKRELNTASKCQDNSFSIKTDCILSVQNIYFNDVYDQDYLARQLDS